MNPVSPKQRSAQRSGTDALIGSALALVSLAVYLITLSPSIGPEDAGELAAAARTLGVAHPTGYPLFSLLGRAFSMLPLGDLRVIVKLNLLGALLCAAAVGISYRLFLLLLRDNVFGAGTGARTAHTAADTAELQTRSTSRIAAATGALVFGFSPVVWTNAVTVEVYALHIFFLTLVTLLFALSIRARIESPTPVHLRADDSPGGSLWMVFAYLLGLSFTNHMMTVLLLPAFTVLYFSTHGGGRAAWLKIVRGLPLFFLALSAYLYLPLRAAARPMLNWGAPATPENFWLHLTGEQYRDKMFSSATVAWNKWIEFCLDLPSAFGILPLALAALGLILLAGTRGRLFVFTALIFVTSVFYAINYDFNDANFRLNAHLIVAFWMTYGFMKAFTKVESLVKLSRSATTASIGVLGIVVAAFPLVRNYETVNEHGNYVVEDFARNVLESLDTNAVFVSQNFNLIMAPARYLQLVEGVRPDVTLLDATGLLRPWYYQGLDTHHPGLTTPARAEIADYLRERERFYRIYSRADAGTPGRRQDSLVIVAKVTAVLRTILLGNAAVRPVYVSPDVELAGFPAVYSGFSFRVYQGQPPVLGDLPTLSIRPFVKNDTRSGITRAHYALGFANTGLAYVNQGDTARGIALLHKAVALQPHFPEAREWLRILGDSP
jgi:hypothetical protein